MQKEYSAIAFLAMLTLFCAVPPATAQTASSTQSLNEHCIVSVLNRTSQVKADGTYAIPNTPANMGLVRARATCVEDGKTVSGQSGFMTIPPNGVVTVAEILLGAVYPIPTALNVTAPTTILTSAGATVSLQVIATYPDGSTKEVPFANAGTSYSR